MIVVTGNLDRNDMRNCRSNHCTHFFLHGIRIGIKRCLALTFVTSLFNLKVVFTFIYFDLGFHKLLLITLRICQVGEIFFSLLMFSLIALNLRFSLFFLFQVIHISKQVRTLASFPKECAITKGWSLLYGRVHHNWPSKFSVPCKMIDFESGKWHVFMCRLSFHY